MSNLPTSAGDSHGERSDYRYWAFISYSHRDSKYAKRLHSELERRTIPPKLIGRETPYGKLPARLFPVFLDREEISGGESLDAVIRAALSVSRYLIVICSPYSAASKYVNDEIRLFKTMGRGTRIIYLIVSGDPAGDDSMNSLSGACFPVMACCQVDSDGKIGGERISPIAADARPGKDGWQDAFLKVMAQVLGVGFDELKLRELHRQRRARMVYGTMIAGLGALLFFAYAAAADAGLHMPFCNDLRSWLDRHELSAFRHVPSNSAIRSAARSLQDSLLGELLTRRQEDGWFNDAPPGQAPITSVMSHSQALAALGASLNRPGRNQDHFSKWMDSLPLPFSEGIPVVQNGVKMGWGGTPGTGSGHSFTALWTAVALGEALRDPAVKSDQALRLRLGDHLQYTAEVLELFHHKEDPGAWDAYPFQVNPRQHSVYASTLALMALTETQQAALPWNGAVEKRDDLIRQTSRWLISQYRSEGIHNGWLNDPQEEHVSDVFDGLTAQTYCALMQAQQTDVLTELPPKMWEDIRLYLASCGTRRSDYAVDVCQFSIPYKQADGTQIVGSDGLRFLWWPWAVRCSRLWLRHAEQQHLPAEQRVQAQRTLAHLINDLGPREIAKSAKGYSYTISEALFCFGKSFDGE